MDGTVWALRRSRLVHRRMPAVVGGAGIFAGQGLTVLSGAFICVRALWDLAVTAIGLYIFIYHDFWLGPGMTASSLSKSFFWVAVLF